MFRRTSEKRAFEAVQQGDLAALEKLARAERSRGRNILNAVDENQRTFLRRAVIFGHEHIIRWLLSDEGGRALGFTNVFSRDRLGETAFHTAAFQGDLACCKAIVEGCKVENGEREQMLNAVTNENHTALHFASRSEPVIRWLLSDEEGGGRALGFTNVLAKDRNEVTALHAATFVGRVACCRAIADGCKVENGEREQMLNDLNDHGQTMLHLAAIYRHENLIRWLLSNKEGGGRSYGFKSESVTALSADSESALHEVVLFGSSAIVQTLLSGCTSGERIKLFLAVNKHGWTALHCATHHFNIASIREILRWEEAKMIVNARDNRGMTALHRMACNGGLDEESRKEWGTAFFGVRYSEEVVKTLLGLSPQTTTTTETTTPATTRTALAFADVNAGLHISEEAKIAAEEEKKRRAALEKENQTKRFRCTLSMFTFFFFSIIAIILGRITTGE